MPIPTVTIDYTVPAKSVSVGTISAALAAVPIPFDILTMLGSYVATDVMSVVGFNVKRELVIKTVPTDIGTLTPNLLPGQSGSPIASFTITDPGAGYVAPPSVRIQDPPGTRTQFLAGTSIKGARAQAYLKLVAAPHLLAGGASYAATSTIAFVGGFPLGDSRTIIDNVSQLPTGKLSTRVSDPPAGGLTVGSVKVTSPGGGYSAATVVQVLGDPPLVRRARMIPVITGGKVTSIQIVDGGEGYITPPRLAIVDPMATPGTGAEAVVSMQRGRPATATLTIALGVVTAITLTDGGDGYITAPSVVINDPTGVGVGAAATAGPVIGGAASVMGVGRVDVLNGGSGYVAPAATFEPLFTAEFFVAAAKGDVTTPLAAFRNLMKTAIQNALATQVVETVS